MTPDEIVTQLFDLFAARGMREYGESVSEEAHALQSAWLASRQGEAAPMMATCLLHDVGHLLHEWGEEIAKEGIDAQHELVGATELAHWFPPVITEPIRLHVEAKRYLCAVDPTYLTSLSPASHHSLQLQGGIMTAKEVQDFLQLESAGAAIRLRRYDDAAKEPGRAVPGLESYRSLLVSLIQVPSSGLSP
ncbi:MAG: HD domain-containing protein [Blastocatellia bacterium]